MVWQFLQLLPEGASPVVRASLIVCTLVGALAWLTGARFNRFLMALLTVSLGAAVGMSLPGWFGWSIPGAGPAIGAAVVLGVSGFVLHGMWAGIVLGLTLALWATFVTWICVNAGQPMVWPQVSETTTCISYCTELWNSLPVTMQRMTPFWVAAGMISGLAGAILWSRFTTRLAWSALGVTMVVGAGLASVHFARPDWLVDRVPQTWLQGVIIVAAVLLGVLVQSTITRPRTVKKPTGPAPENDPPE